MRHGKKRQVLQGQPTGVFQHHIAIGQRRGLLKIGRALVFFQNILAEGQVLHILVNEHCRQVPVIARHIPTQGRFRARIFPFWVIEKGDKNDAEKGKSNYLFGRKHITGSKEALVGVRPR